MAGNSFPAAAGDSGATVEEDMVAFDLLPPMTKQAIGTCMTPWSPKLVLRQFNRRDWPLDNE